MRRWRRLDTDTIAREDGCTVHRFEGRPGRMFYRAARGGSPRRGPDWLAPWRESRVEAVQDCDIRHYPEVIRHDE